MHEGALSSLLEEGKDGGEGEDGLPVVVIGMKMRMKAGHQLLLLLG